jgi:hypothetical protein
MSGTKAHEQREKDRRQAETKKLIIFSRNRGNLLITVADYMHNTYGNSSFYDNHPLVSAILQSVNGNIIDLLTLADDISNYQPSETE